MVSTLSDFRELVVAQFHDSIETPPRFFQDNADLIARCSFEMARRFQRGGRLLVFGSGASTTDAQHVAVEFVHPVIVGKRALPSMALTNDIGSVLGLMQSAGADEIFARQLQLLGMRDDIAMGLTTDGGDEKVLRALDIAREMEMLTIGMCGDAADNSRHARSMFETSLDFCFRVPSNNPYVIQEVQETTYHILWETVHVFFEQQVANGR